MRPFYIGKNNKIRQVAAVLRALPRQFSNLVRTRNLLQSRAKAVWFRTSAIVSSQQMSSRAIREHLFSDSYPQIGLRIEKVYKRADWPPPGQNYDSSLGSIWSIKNPTLRSIRLKIMYKDIFSNERRFRFKIAPSPLCDLCGQVETVEHHLFLCDNAKRVWQLFYRITGDRVESLFDVLKCSRQHATEVVKSVLMKSLLQIDRSHDVTERELVSLCLFYLGIEARSNQDRAIDIRELRRKLIDWS